MKEGQFGKTMPHSNNKCNIQFENSRLVTKGYEKIEAWTKNKPEVC